jgi:hypothetical protein
VSSRASRERPERARGRVVALVALAAVAALAGMWVGSLRSHPNRTAHRLPPPPPVLHATPASFGSVFSGAQGGDVISLGAGDYGSFGGGSKPAVVTIRPEPGAAVSMAVSFSSASNLRLEGLTVRGATIGGSTRNVTIANSVFTEAALVDTTQGMVNANIVFDGDRFSGISVCSTCYEGRLTIHGSKSVNTQPVGVTVQNSLFNGGGNSDGIQVGSYGVQILNNEFTDLHQGDPSLAHTDALQLYGQSHTVVRGNYMHNVATGIMSPDGADHEVIENNVILTEGYASGIVLGPDNGSVIRHNTLPDAARGGQLRITTANQPGAPSRGSVVTDNVIASLLVEGDSTLAAEDHNLIAQGGGKGVGDLKGKAAFSGGGGPANWLGFTLAPGSLGKGAASDGSDIGINNVAAPAPAPVAAVRPSLSGPGGGPLLALLRPRVGATFRSRVSAAATATDDTGIRRVDFWLDNHRRAGVRSGPFARTLRAGRHSWFGRHTLSVRAVAKDGQSSSAAVTLIRRRGGSRSRGPAASRVAWQFASAPTLRGTVITGQGPARRKVTVTLARCSDHKGKAAARVRVRSGADGKVTIQRRRRGLCVLRLK